MTEKQNKLIDMVLHSEGGWTAPTSGDRGGETYRGVARNFFPRWEGWQRVDSYKPLKREQIISDPVLETMCRKFYATTFYAPLHIDEIADPQIAAHLFDHGVNAGMSGAVKLLQKSINIACGTAIAVDGKLGPITLGHVNGASRGRIALKFAEMRESYYRRIATGAKAKFLRGWLNRVKYATQAGKSL